MDTSKFDYLIIWCLVLEEIAVLSCLMSALELLTKMCQSGTKTWSECVKTSQLFLLETKWMLRTEKSRQNRSLSTERRICNTMISVLRATINLKSLSFGF